MDLTYEGSKYYMAYNAGYDILDYIEDTLGENYTDGFYRFKLVLSNEATYYTEIFRINEFSTIEVIGVGDFSEDFNNDFSKP
jgi:hypothetical protein